MAQQDILDLLKNNKNKWFTAREIAEELGVSVDGIHVGLRKLRAARFVNHEFRNNSRTQYRIYKYKEDI